MTERQLPRPGCQTCPLHRPGGGILKRHPGGERHGCIRSCGCPCGCRGCQAPNIAHRLGCLGHLLCGGSPGAPPSCRWGVGRHAAALVQQALPLLLAVRASAPSLPLVHRRHAPACGAEQLAAGPPAAGSPAVGVYLQWHVHALLPPLQARKGPPPCGGWASWLGLQYPQSQDRGRTRKRAQLKPKGAASSRRCRRCRWWRAAGLPSG